MLFRSEKDIYILKDKLPKNISHIDLSDYTPKIKKETEIKSCLTHVVLSAIETMINIYLTDLYPNQKRKKFKHIKEFLKNNNHNIFSETYLYENVQNKYGNNVTYRHILKYLSNNGIEIENDNGTQYYKVSEYMRIKNSGRHDNNHVSIKKSIVNTMKFLLQKSIPIIGAFRVPHNIKKSEKNGIINSNDRVNFNYGVLFVGYYDNFNGTGKGYFKFQNSWGRRWGEQGFGYLPYASIKKQKCLDLWVISDLEINGLPGSISYNSYTKHLNETKDTSHDL